MLWHPLKINDHSSRVHLELKSELSVYNKCVTTIFNRKIISQFVWGLLLCNVLANRSGKACDNKSKQIHSALT